MIDMQPGLCGYLVKASRRALERSCTRKRRYEQRATAEGVLLSMTAQGCATPTLRVYPCEFCDGFHLGNQD